MTVSIDAHNHRVGEDNNSMKFLALFVNRIDEGTGWWHYFPIPSIKEDTSTQHIFHNASNMFGLREEAMEIFCTGARCMKNKDTKIFFCHDGHDNLKELVVVTCSIEISSAWFDDSKTKKQCIKLGY